jgi:hypothetical protein
MMPTISHLNNICRTVILYDSGNFLMVMAVNACTFIADDPPYPPMEHIEMEIVFIYSTEG